MRGAHDFTWPRKWALSFLIEALVNSLRLRKILRFTLPKVPMLKSDIQDVVYLNWLVPIERMQHLLPHQFKADIHGSSSWISILVFRHGHFGPKFLGRLRRFFSSPLQSNWRAYVEPGKDSVYFFKSATDSIFNAITSRLLSDGLPSHLPASMDYTKVEDSIRLKIDPGIGSAPDLKSRLRVSSDKSQMLETWLPYLIEQNSALSLHGEKLLRAEIKLQVDLESVKLLKVEEFQSKFLAPVVEGIEPLAFFVPKVGFEYLGERWIEEND